jgi:hypothetical protein
MHGIKKTLPAKWSIRANNPWKQCWDVYIVILVIYTILIVPLELGFSRGGNDVSPPNYTFSLPGIDLFDLFCDGCFLLDLVLVFFTTQYDSLGNERTNLVVIGKEYLRGYFIIDLLSCIPFDRIAGLNGESGVNVVFKLLKIPRLLRVTRIFKLLDHMAIAVSWRVLKLTFSVLLTIHCISAILGVIIEFPDSTWLSSQNQTYVQFWATRYLLCFHSIVGMCFGGSMNPTTIAELIFEPIVIFVGAALQAVRIKNKEGR